MNTKLKLGMFSLLSLLIISCVVGAETPSYNEIFAEQLKCSSSYFKSSKWNQKLPLLAKMESGTVVVISKPTVTALPPKVYKNMKPEDKKVKDSHFKVNSTFYKMFDCDGRRDNYPNKETGSNVETLIAVFESKAGSGKFMIAGDEPADFPGTDPKIFSPYLYGSEGDESIVGMFCVVLAEDFVKNSNSIDLDKLCKGQPAKNREATKLKIEQARKELIAKGVK